MNDTTTKSCASCFKDIDGRALRCPFCSGRQADVGISRDVPGRIAGGVCASLAQHFNWDVTLMRIAFIVSVAFTGTLVLWVYAAAWLMTPFEAHGKSPLARAFEWTEKLFSPRKTGLEQIERVR